MNGSAAGSSRSKTTSSRLRIERSSSKWRTRTGRDLGSCRRWRNVAGDFASAETLMQLGATIRNGRQRFARQDQTMRRYPVEPANLGDQIVEHRQHDDDVALGNIFTFLEVGGTDDDGLFH